MNDPSEQFDRLPPHSVESEMCLVASIVVDRDVREEVLQFVRKDDFFQSDHQVIFNLIAERHRDGKAVDWHLIREDLIARHLLDEVGGVGYLAQIINAVPSAAHGVHYGKIVVQCSRLRAIIAACHEGLRDAYAPNSRDDWERLLKKMGDDLLSIQHRGTRETIKHVSEILQEAIERKMDGSAKKIPTGLRDIDTRIGGLGIGRMTVIGAKPGMGKSLLAKQIWMNVARAGIPAGVIAIEEDRFKIADNLLSNESRVHNSVIAYDRYDQVQWGKILAATPAFRNLPMYADDERSDLAGVEGSIARMATKFGCKVVIVDYLQLITPEQDRNGTREQEVRRISNSLKMMFKRLNVAGVVTAQLNRGSGTEPPQMHNLRESGAIEQDGDLVMLLHREDYYHLNEEGYVPTFLLDVNIAKNKDGPPGVEQVMFDGQTQAIYDRQGPVDPF